MHYVHIALSSEGFDLNHRERERQREREIEREKRETDIES